DVYRRRAVGRRLLAVLGVVLGAASAWLPTSSAVFVGTTTNPGSAVAASSNFLAGSLYRFGANNDPPLNPVQFGPDTWLSVATSNDHVCGIQPDNTLWCWGYNDRAQLGQGTTDGMWHAPTQVGAA